MTDRAPAAAPPSRSEDRHLAAAGFFVLAALYGTLYTFPALAPQLDRSLHASRADIVGAFAVLLLVAAAASLPAGRLLDRFGPRPALVAGVGLLTAGWLAASQATAAWHLYLAMNLLLAPAFALVQVSALVALSRSTHRGRALGVGGAGMGGGLTIVPVAAIWLSQRSDWRTAFLALAALGALAAPAAWLLGRRRTSRPSALGRREARGLLRSRPFVVLFGGGIAIGVLDEAVYQHLVPHLTNTGLRATQAGALLALTSAVYIVGQLVGGLGADRWGSLRVGSFAAAAAAAGLLLFALGDSLSPAGLFAAAALYGLGLGGTIVVRTALLAEVFDGPSFGTVAGVYQWAYAVGGAAIGWFGAVLFGRSGTYVPAFVLGIAAAAIWIVCLVYASAVSRRLGRARTSLQPREAPSQ
jgi:MFS family permease